MRSLLRGGWILLPLLACATEKTAQTDTPATAVASAPAAAPVFIAPRLPEAPSVMVIPASHPADHLLPGPCRTRRVSGPSGGQSIEVTTYRWDERGRLLSDEVVDVTGDVLRNGEIKLDKEGRASEIIEKGPNRKPAETITYKRDKEGRVVAEERTHGAEKKPYFSRTLERGGDGRVSGESWKVGAASWKLTARLDSAGDVAALVAPDGMERVRYLRGGAGNPVMESMTMPDGTEVRLMSEYGCFGVDENATTALAAQCGPDRESCLMLSLLLGEQADTLGLAPDLALSEAYKARACHNGDAPTCMWLADHAHSQEAERGYAYHAMDLSREACEMGKLDGCNLAERIAGSASFDVDPRLRPALDKRALELATKACDAGDGKACLEAADRVARAEVSRAADPVRAKELYDRACKLGTESGCKMLAGDDR